MLIGLFLYVRLSHIILIVIEILRFPPVTQHYRPYWLYFISFVIIITGLVTYFWHSTRKIIFLLCWSLINFFPQLKSKVYFTPNPRHTSTRGQLQGQLQDNKITRRLRRISHSSQHAHVTSFSHPSSQKISPI